MKSLHKMDNLDRGELLCKLFPEELSNIQNAIKKQCEYFIQNETAFRKGWHQTGFFTANFWYGLVHSAHKRVGNNENELCKRPRSFSDHFFDGYNALFAMHCLIEYKGTKECNEELKQAIHLLFGSEKLISIVIQKDGHK